MMDALKEVIKQPYWVIALVLGGLLVALPCITIDKDHHWTTHPPDSLLLVVVGIALLLVSVAAFGFWLWPKHATGDDSDAGLDLALVKESDGVISTTVGDCEIRVINGRLEDHPCEAGTAIVLPCNEYFDDQCAADPRSALGAYVGRIFEGQAARFMALVKDECKRRFGDGIGRQKTDDERGKSFGTGRCVLLSRPLDRSMSVALVSTTTQRAGEGLAARISYLFEGMRELVTRLADARISDVAMPVLGAGHGHIHASLALVGLILAVAEAARYGQGGQRLRRVTIVVFRRDAASAAEVDPIVIRRTLALVGSRD
jgi:hypothetical protein